MKRRVCRQGHPVTGWNRVWKVSRGTEYAQCRLCRNEYQKELMRQRRRKGIA